MSTVQLLKESNVARYGTYALVILFYVIYTLGTLLEFGLSGITAQTPAIRIGVASVAFIIALGILRWFFETKAE